MGLLGFRELLERFTRLEERQQELEERLARLEERFAELEERFARLEERQQKLEERFAQLEERFARLEEEFRDTRRLVMVIAHRYGIITEEAFRQAMKYVVEEVFGTASVSRWVYADKDGKVYGWPSIVEVDVLVKDGHHILLEVKSRVSKGDVAELYRKGRLYEEVEGVKPKLAIVGGFIDPGAKELAKSLGVDVKPIVKD